MDQVEADVVREAVLEVARAEYRLCAARASADREKFHVGPAEFASAVLPCGKTMRQLWDAKQEAIIDLTGGVLSAAPGRVRAQVVQLAYGIAKQGTPVSATALDRQITSILALGGRPAGEPAYQRRSPRFCALLPSERNQDDHDDHYYVRGPPPGV
jgi:hypothetical protein